ncbi:hypothetical protein D7X33_14055 [Butyricicoccus sp. 1XD8-22]|nr:hypothetical protein D7X33_14055 [Butyricicoccus sp. 1XD8-22]
MDAILVVAGVVILLMLIIFPGIRGKLKILIGGFLNIFVEDIAKTPEGAEAVYQQKIEEMEKQYDQASTVYHRLEGEKRGLESSVERLRASLKTVEQQCERLVFSGKMEDARVVSEQRSDILNEIDTKSKYLKEITPRVEEARDIHSACGRSLQKLKKEKKQVIDELLLNGTMKNVLNDLDELKRTSDTDKLLGSIRDYREDLQKEVAGASAVHNNRVSTKLQKAEESTRRLESDSYLESLKKKYSAGK